MIFTNVAVGCRLDTPILTLHAFYSIYSAIEIFPCMLFLANITAPSSLSAL